MATLNEQSDRLPPHMYLQQTARAYRFLDRYSKARVSMRGLQAAAYTDIEDFLWAFFQNCWHIKDWMKHDPSVPDATIRRGVAAAENHPDIRVAADLANGSKHLGRDPKRVKTGAEDSAIQFHTGADGSTNVEHIIAFPDGTERTAFDCGNRAMDAWQALFRTEGLPYYVNPFAT